MCLCACDNAFNFIYRPEAAASADVRLFILQIHDQTGLDNAFISRLVLQFPRRGYVTEHVHFRVVRSTN